MALSDKLTTGAQTPAQAAPQSKKEEKMKKDTAFAEKGSALRSTMAEDQKAVEGSKSDKVAFVCCLINPAKRQNRVANKESILAYQNVGYKFKALEDMQVPVAPLKEKFASDVDVENVTFKPVKKGEIFALNICETGILITQLPYAGSFTGEGQTVTVTVRHANNRPDPLPVLRKVGSSIKEVVEEVATKATVDGKDVYTVKDEYAEKFGVYFRKDSARKKSADASKKSGERQKDVAAAFRDFYAAKFQV